MTQGITRTDFYADARAILYNPHATPGEIEAALIVLDWSHNPLDVLLVHEMRRAQRLPKPSPLRRFIGKLVATVAAHEAVCGIIAALILARAAGWALGLDWGV